MTYSIRCYLLFPFSFLLFNQVQVISQRRVISQLTSQSRQFYKQGLRDEKRLPGELAIPKKRRLAEYDSFSSQKQENMRNKLKKKKKVATNKYLSRVK